MDVTQIAAVATNLTQKQQSDSLNVMMEKRALDSQKLEATGLIAAIPQPPTTGTLGQTVNVMA